MNGMNQIYLCSHLVLNVVLGKGKEEMWGQLLKPLTTNSTYTTNSHQGNKILSLGSCIAFLVY